VKKVLDVSLIKSDFPIFNRKIRDNQKLIYLDSAATSQKPEVVVNAERDFYFEHNAAAHRGAHQLAEEATELFEESRGTVAKFLGALDQRNRLLKVSTWLHILSATLSLDRNSI
jgi:cysteine desulfurase/selenocysteine lyase